MSVRLLNVHGMGVNLPKYGNFVEGLVIATSAATQQSEREFQPTPASKGAAPSQTAQLSFQAKQGTKYKIPKSRTKYICNNTTETKRVLANPPCAPSDRELS